MALSDNGDEPSPSDANHAEDGPEETAHPRYRAFSANANRSFVNYSGLVTDE